MESMRSCFSRNPLTAGRCILIAVDGSECSKQAFHYYLKWIARPDDSLVIFHAIEPVSLPSMSINNLGSVPSDEWSKIVQNNLQRVKELESEYAAECQAHNVTHQFLYEAVDQTGEAIVVKAARHHARLVILGSRGLGVFRRTIMGSISDYVLHHANIPVCVVPLNAET
ncbi:unnamed protein product [Calicophoron daubneyi]|uniref:UspA domain-containing protein n=1 Tax=Calicophoron daubneyi TaxID=300641 RepID=A0AAV2TLI3_CALDB